MQALYSVNVRIDGDSTSIFDNVQREVGRWALAGEAEPDGFFIGRGSTAVSGRELRWDMLAVESSPHRLWVLEVCTPLGEGGEAEFVCAVSVSQVGDVAGMRVELGRRSKVARLAPVHLDFMDRPRLVPHIVATLPCYYGEERVHAQPIRVRAGDIRAAIELLTRSSRRLPVVVVSSTNDGSPEARFASVLASRLSGLAHVVLLETWLALDSLNAQYPLRVPLRGSRLFWPISAGTTRDPWWTSALLTDARAVSDRIFTMLSRLSVVANPRDHLAEAVRAAERNAVRERTERRIEAATVSGDLRQLVDELQAQVREEQEWSASLIEINEELERENRELRTYKENFEAITRWSDATSAEAEPALEELQVSPDFRELWPALEAESERALIFTEAAKESWIDSDYPYPDRMRKTLEALARAAVAWRAVGGRLGKSMVTWMWEEFSLSYAPDDEGMRRRKIDTFKFGDVSLSRLPHIKIDDYVSPDRVGRIYFAIDEQEDVGIAEPGEVDPDKPRGRWIVDHVGIKLGL